MNKLPITLLSLLTLATACTNDIDETTSNNQGKTAIVKATIGTSETIIARAELDADGISYTSFDTNDKIGLFAEGGLTATNKELTYDNGSFKNTDLQWTGDNAKNVYAYFPYSNNADETINIWREANTSLSPTWKAGFNDMLIATNSSIPEGAVINLGFSHQFAMLVIVRGDGFDKVDTNKKDVSITLNQPVSQTATISYSNNAASFTLNAGTDNNVEKLDATPGKYDSKDVDCVIIPIGTIGITPVNVESITLYNDLGREMTVAYSIKDTPQKNTKYVITVEMRDNQAIASPVEIVRWDDETIHIEEPAGIKDVEGFKTWVAAYNDLSTSNRDNVLAQYGSKGQDNKWTFRLKDNITLTDAGSFNGITTFSDIFDGQGYTITGINIQETSSGNTVPTGFVRTLSGTIKRLTLKDALVYGTNDIGAFAGKAESDATIENCQLTGASIVFGTTNVGAFIGNNDVSGTITNCTKASTVIVKTQSTN